jgi:hypothetical protein
VSLINPIGATTPALSRAGVSHETYLLPGNEHRFGTQFARTEISDLRRQHGGR